MPRPRRVVPMAGVPIALDATDDARWRAVDALFGTCRDVTAAPELSIELGAVAPDSPARPADVHFSDVDMWFTDRGIVTRHESGLTIARDGLAIEAGGPDIGGDLSRAFRRSVQHVLVDAMADLDRFALHAAAFEAPGGDGAVVVLGDTGAGKSTLAIVAQSSGWAVLTDDICWLRLDGNCLTVTGFPKPLHVPPDLRHAVPDATDRIVGDERSRFVSRAGLATDDVPRVVRGVVEVRHGTAAEGALTPLPPGPELFKTAMRSFPLQRSPSRVRDFFPYAARLSRLPASRLEHAADPATRAAHAAELLESAWAGFVQ
jgi:hypothetical protein